MGATRGTSWRGSDRWCVRYYSLSPPLPYDVSSRTRAGWSIMISASRDWEARRPPVPDVIPPGSATRSLSSSHGPVAAGPRMPHAAGHLATRRPSRPMPPPSLGSARHGGSTWTARVVRRRWNQPCRLRPSEAWAAGPAPSAACSCSHADAKFMLGLTEWALPPVQHYRPRGAVVDGSIAASQEHVPSLTRVNDHGPRIQPLVQRTPFE
jgi:hypothetical protein